MIPLFSLIQPSHHFWQHDTGAQGNPSRDSRLTRLRQHRASELGAGIYRAVAKLNTHRKRRPLASQRIAA